MNRSFMFWMHPLRMLLIMCLALPALGARAAEPLQAVNPDGATKLGLKHPAASIILWTKKLGSTFPYKNALLWGGDVGELPEDVVSSIQVQAASVGEIFVPLSAYADLGDVKFASLNPIANGFILGLHGGETATSYDAKLVFKNGFLVSRIITLRENPQESREETTYSFPKRTGE